MEKILLVDDEPNILQAYKRILRRDFNVFTAESGREGIAMIEREGEFAVIVSDMRMPEMNGIEFLTRTQEMYPDTIRIMLTGDAGQQTAMDAVNEGKIFRFLTKPCSLELLSNTLFTCIKQYRLIKAEKQLLEETLTKSLQVLVDILALINPTAFSRSTRVKRLAKDIAIRLGLENTWEIEVAAMLSQIGCITVPEDILKKINGCKQLSESELRLYNQHPNVGFDLVTRIPRMNDVAQIIAHQNIRFADEKETKSCLESTISNRLNTRIIKMVLDYDKLLDFGNTPLDAYNQLLDREGWYDPMLISVLREFIDEKVEEYISIETDVAHLRPGMIFDEPLYSINGNSFIEKGQEITFSLILRLNNFVDAGIIADKFQVRVPIYGISDNSSVLSPINETTYDSESYLAA
jgi:response regulator RpfG family c-di-GMP phosphodiesterase